MQDHPSDQRQGHHHAHAYPYLHCFRPAGVDRQPVLSRAAARVASGGLRGRGRRGCRGRNDQALPGADSGRHDREGRRRRDLLAAGAREGRHSGQVARPRRRPPQHRRAPQRQRKEAAAADHGAHRRGQRRSRRSGRIRRSAPRATDGYVYGRGAVDDKDNVVAGADDHADAEAPERAARSRRHLPRRSRRGRHDARRHPVHGQSALSGDRRGILPGRRRQRDASGRAGQVRVGADDGEDSAGDRADRARPVGARIGAAAVERDRPSRERRQRARQVARAGAPERDDARVFRAARRRLDA